MPADFPAGHKPTEARCGEREPDLGWLTRHRAAPPETSGPPTGDRMGADDKIENKADEVKGKVKEAVGDATDDRELQTEGQADQAKGNLKQAGEKIKDAFKS